MSRVGPTRRPLGRDRAHSAAIAWAAASKIKADQKSGPRMQDEFHLRYVFKLVFGGLFLPSTLHASRCLSHLRGVNRHMTGGAKGYLITLQPTLQSLSKLCTRKPRVRGAPRRQSNNNTVRTRMCPKGFASRPGTYCVLSTNASCSSTMLPPGSPYRTCPPSATTLRLQHVHEVRYVSIDAAIFLAHCF